MVVMAVTMGLAEFTLAYAAVAVGIEFAEQGIGTLCIDANGTEGLFEFGLADFPVTVRIQLRKEIGG